MPEKEQEEESQAPISPSDSEKFLAILEENLALNKEIRAMVRHINAYVAWRRILGWIKLLLILVPILLGFIYLPPIIEKYVNQISSLSNPTNLINHQ